MVNNELYHYGVLGMRWGVRRFQKKDGSLTTAGKKRAAENDDQSTEQATRTATKSSSSSSKKSIRDMTDEELVNKINRMSLEKRYKELAAQVNPPKSTKGRDFAMRVMDKIGENVITNLGTQAANKLIGDAINAAFKVDSSDTANRIVNPSKGQSDKK